MPEKVLNKTYCWVIEHPLRYMYRTNEKKFGRRIKSWLRKKSTKENQKFIEKVLQQGLANFQQPEIKRNQDNKQRTQPQIQKMLMTILSTSKQSFKKNSNSRKQNKKKNKLRNISEKKQEKEQRNANAKNILKNQQGNRVDIDILSEPHHKDWNEERINSLSRESKKKVAEQQQQQEEK